MDEIEVVFNRCLQCESARDVEVRKVIEDDPLANFADRVLREQDMPESERLKTLVAVLGAEIRHLKSLAMKLSAMQPPPVVLIPYGTTYFKPGNGPVGTYGAADDCPPPEIKIG